MGFIDTGTSQMKVNFFSFYFIIVYILGYRVSINEILFSLGW